MRRPIAELVVQAALIIADDEADAAMKGPKDLPEGAFISITELSDSFIVEFTAKNGSDEGSLVGNVEVVRADEDFCGKVYEVNNAEAPSGWGPLLYDLTMEYAYPLGIMADRASISQAAQRVWWYYFRKRRDVEKIPLDEECEAPVFGEPFDYAYRKKPKLLSELKKLSKLSDPTMKIVRASVSETIADLLTKCRKLGIGDRAKLGDVSVGKKMGKATYVHRTYESMLPGIEPAAGRLPRDFDYTIVKHDADSGCLSFIECADFDTAPEPTVGKSARVCGSEVTWRRPNDDPQIYHHKWTMVTDDYEGFDVAESMRRSIAWKSIVGKDSALSSRIGTKSVWEKEVLPRLEK